MGRGTRLEFFAGCGYAGVSIWAGYPCLYRFPTTFVIIGLLRRIRRRFWL
jgi:hypothetical protein